MGDTIEVAGAHPQTDGQLPRLVVFTSPKSGLCRQVEGWVAHVMQVRRNRQKIKLVTVDADARPDLVERFRVEQLPTLFVVENKIARAKLERPRGVLQINALVAPWLL